MWLLNSEISFTGFTLKVINKQRFTNKQLWFALKPVIRHGRTVNSNMMDTWLCLKNLCCFHALSGLADEVEGNVAGKTISLFHFFFFKSLLFSCSYSYTVISSTVHSALSVGKIQVSIRKQSKLKWTSLGQPLEFHNTFLLKKDRGKIQEPIPLRIRIYSLHLICSILFEC